MDVLTSCLSLSRSQALDRSVTNACIHSFEGSPPDDTLELMVGNQRYAQCVGIGIIGLLPHVDEPIIVIPTKHTPRPNIASSSLFVPSAVFRTSMTVLAEAMM